MSKRPNQPGQGAPYPPQQQGGGYQDQSTEEEILDGSDLEFIDDAGPSTDPAVSGALDPGDTDPAPGYAQPQQDYAPPAAQGQPHQAAPQAAQQGYAQQQQPQQGYQQQQPQQGYQQQGQQQPQQPYQQQQPQQPYQQQQPQAPAGYPAQPGPNMATLPPDGGLSYDQQQGYQQGQPQAAAPHVEEDPTSQQNQEAIQAAIDGKPYTEGPKLLIIGGNNRGKEFPLNQSGDTTIGRGVDNHVILADIAVSRKHTLICFEGGHFVVRDLGSGNGTLLNSRRVDSQALKDGDQLELGNTLMRYVNPMAAAAPAPIAQQATDVLSEAALASEAAPPVQVAPTPGGIPMVGGDPRQATSMAVPVADPVKVAPAGATNRRKKLLIFGGIGLIVFFGAMIGLKAVIGGKKAEQAAAQGPSDDQVAAQEFQEGTTQFRAKEWEKAQTHFLKVLKLAPKFEDARRYADQAAAELKARDALAAADTSLKAKNYKASRVELSKVPSTSVYAGDARKAKQKVDDAQLSDLLTQTKKLKEEGQLDKALARITEARDLAPTNEAVKTLYTELSAAAPGESGGSKPVAVASRKPSGGSSARRPSGGSSARRPSGGSSASSRQPKVKAIRVGGGAKQALGLYKQQQWAQAFQSIKSYAAAQSGSRKRKAESLADAIRKVGQNWIRASKSSKPAQALKYYQQAMVYDRKVSRGGMHQAKLKELIFKQARKEASTALARGRYTTAFAAYKLARRYGPEDATLRKVSGDLEKKAQALFTKGYTKRSSNIAFARKCWQQVLKMVPPSSSAYQKAYKWLNESTPAYEDEDED